VNEVVAASALVLGGVLAFGLAVGIGIVLGRRLDRIMVGRAAAEDDAATDTRADGGIGR
jgi:hypothetical protein